MLPTCGLSLVLLCASLPTGDLVPDAIEQALLHPDDPISFGYALLLGGDNLSTTPEAGLVRCLADVGDANGDGLADVAVGLGPESPGHTLQVRDAGTGRLIWSDRPAGGGFRSLRGLAVRERRLALGLSSEAGRVEVRDAPTGQVLWSRELATQAGAEPASISSVSWASDLDGDGVDDLLVAGGGRVLGVWALSGADGLTLWSHDEGDVVQDATAVHDQDGDGTPDVLMVGGETTPMARLLSGADGHTLWQATLDGPGSVGLGMDDSTGDGVPDVAIGQFNAPGACLLALDGATGARIWTTTNLIHNVTSLTLIGDTVGTGLRDLAVGSFDNALNAVLCLNGLLIWRREVAPFNGGCVFSVVNAGDLDQNGSVDVLFTSLDHRAYLVDGTSGEFMGASDTGRNLAAVVQLADRTGDGRPETALGGLRELTVIDGVMGVSAGPVLEIEAPDPLGDEIRIVVWSFPGTSVLVLAALGPGHLAVPGFLGTFGLDLASVAKVHQGPTPSAGSVTITIDPLPASAAGFTIHWQAVSLYSPGFGIFTDTVSTPIPQ